jgi:hypothetical protein
MQQAKPYIIHIKNNTDRKVPWVEFFSCEKLFPKKKIDDPDFMVDYSDIQNQVLYGIREDAMIFEQPKKIVRTVFYSGHALVTDKILWITNKTNLGIIDRLPINVVAANYGVKKDQPYSCETSMPYLLDKKTSLSLDALRPHEFLTIELYP